MWRITRADSRCFPPREAGPLLSIQADYEDRCWGAKRKVRFIANSCVVNKTVLSAVLNGSLCTPASPCWINLPRQVALVFPASPEIFFYWAIKLFTHLNWCVLLTPLGFFFSWRSFKTLSSPMSSAIPSCPCFVASSWLWIIELHGKTHLCNFNKLTPLRSNLK